MGFKKVTLVKAWTHPCGEKYPEGTTFRCTPDLYNELAEAGYISVPKAPKPKATKAQQKK